MTVAQLIEILNGFNPNDYVMIGNDGGVPSEACDVYNMTKIQLKSIK